MLGFAGVMSIRVSIAAVTRTWAVPRVVPSVAVMVADPAPSPDTTPFEPAVLETKTVAGALDVQIALVVRSTVVMSEYRPVAISGWVPPTAIVVEAGVTV